MLVGIKIKINITNYPDRELIFFFFLLQQFTLFIARVGWAGLTFGKTDVDVLIYKKQADRKRKIGERIIEYV